MLRNNESSTEDYEILAPKAESIIHSMRAFGYDITTAVADLIDNSIVAGAKNIYIDFYWEGLDSKITVLDDGIGMSERQLVNAMLLGSSSPLLERHPKDLGRFGLGLKTASFSQCKRLTVRTKEAKSKSYQRCWDLDCVTESQEWRLLKNSSDSSSSLLNRLDKLNHGTIVIWESLDKVIGELIENDEKARKNFWNLADLTKTHVAKTFHRFLEGKDKRRMYINNKMIEPWDPFLSNHSATQILPEENIYLNNKIIKVVPYVLPHNSKITQETYNTAAADKGWNSLQGFYIYRNKRLIVSGDWLGLPFKKEENYKLARIQIDIPNNTDEEWDIDVKKSKAKVPYQIREDLIRIAKLTRERANSIFRHRGKIVARQTAKDYVYVWNQTVKHGKVSYKINRENPIIKEAMRLDKNLISALLKTIEETIPIETIVYKKQEDPENQLIPFDKQIGELKKILEINYRVLIKTGLTFQEAKRRLMVMEPFNMYIEAVEACLDEFKEGKNE